MDHPNIARVLDAGTTEHGRPFFVMELVKGIPITEYCDQHRLDLAARLALFRQVCSAVQHAHQKGIIHRDLKPSNILVESHDGKPVPKVIDFGLAKATSGMRLTEQSLFTAFGTRRRHAAVHGPGAGRLQRARRRYPRRHLRPGRDPLRAADRLDAHPAGHAQAAALDEMLRLIREVEPPTPSSRISTSEALPSIAASRHVQPTQLSRLVRGDLDWIVMKALAKERNRRYESAIGLANDIERLPITNPSSAGPPTAAYRHDESSSGETGCRWRRRRWFCWPWSAAWRARPRAAGGPSAKREGSTTGAARRGRSRGEGTGAAGRSPERQKAEKRLAQVTKMNEILGSIFRDLDPKNAAKDGKPLSAVLGERLDRATAEIEGEATGDPLAVAGCR